MGRKADPIRVVAFAVVCAAALFSCATFQRQVGSPEVSQLKYTFDENLADRFGRIPSISLDLRTRPAERLSAEPVYFSRAQRYAEIRMGMGSDNVLTMVLDESRGTGSGYDILYVDANNNNDLSDDPKLMGEPESDTTRLVFPTVELTVVYGDEAYPFHVSPALYAREWAIGDAPLMTPLRRASDTVERTIELSAACYCEGELTLGRERHKVALFDDTMNGLFNDRWIAPEERGQPGRTDALLIDIGGEITEHRVGRYISLGDVCYGVDIAPDGRTITLRRGSTRCGRLKLSAEHCSVLLFGRDSAFVLEGLDEITVPAGKYELLRCRFEAEDDHGQLWRIVDRGQLDDLAVKVRANRTTPLAFGPPLLAEVFVTQRSSKSFRFDLAITGKGGEKYSGRDFERVGEGRPPAPRLEIRDEGGNVVATGQFEYG